ncbi:MAG: hypothetical protein JOY80_10230 [Candidatus Dormibacteraeota bacterium]|nr:hypothetical protein [Candidatus Dormibacteraeota bacterium]
MPWSVVVRMIARLAAGLFMWRAATARRGSYGTPGSPPVQSAPPHQRPVRLGGESLVLRVREGASLGWRALAATVFVSATALLLTGGITLTVLTPRWLGILLLVLASITAAAAIGEVVAARRLLAVRRKRRHAADLRREVS